MIAGKRWCESRSEKRPTLMPLGGRVAEVISTSFTWKRAPESSVSTRNESPTTVTRRCRGLTPGSSMRTSLPGALPTVSEARS